MAAFVPYVAAALIFDAFHFHPIAPQHGPNCPHHLSDQPDPLRTSTGYACPSCNWQRNLQQSGDRTWTADFVPAKLPVLPHVAVAAGSREDIQPALFRGPPPAVL